MTNQWYSPAKIYGQLYKDEMKTAPVDRDINEESKLPNKVSISENGEVVLLPDIAKVSISYKSIKESVDAVKHSIQRRIDYILQALRNNGIKETQYNIQKHLERIADQFQMFVEINVEFLDFKACQEISNFLVEKLDENVVISRPIFCHTPGKLDAARRQACVNAVKNARSKADAIAQFVNQKLGSVLEIKEESVTELTGAPVQDLDASEFSNKARIEASTITVNVKVSATFEILPKQKKKKH